MENLSTRWLPPEEHETKRKRPLAPDEWDAYIAASRALHAASEKYRRAVEKNTPVTGDSIVVFYGFGERKNDVAFPCVKIASRHWYSGGLGGHLALRFQTETGEHMVYAEDSNYRAATSEEKLRNG